MDSEILHNTDSFKGYKDIDIFYQSWVPRHPRAAVIIIPGVGEHSSRYSDVGSYLAGIGCSTYAYDLRGNGRSGGIRGHVTNFNEYLLDLKHFLEHLSFEMKVFILGHSLGGLIAIQYAILHPQGVSGIIATSPALGLKMKVPTWKRALAYALHTIYPLFSLVDDAVSTKYLTHDRRIVEAFDNDPLVNKRRTARFFVEFMRACAKANREAERLKTPCLFLQAGDDKIVSIDTLKKFYHKVSADKKMIKVYSGFYHEILNETGRDAVLKDIGAWIGASMQE
jgi:lysophospholipase